MTMEKMEGPTPMQMEQAWMANTLWLLTVTKHKGQGRWDGSVDSRSLEIKGNSERNR